MKHILIDLIVTNGGYPFIREEIINKSGEAVDSNEEILCEYDLFEIIYKVDGSVSIEFLYGDYGVLELPVERLINSMEQKATEKKS